MKPKYIYACDAELLELVLAFAQRSDVEDVLSVDEPEDLLVLGAVATLSERLDKFICNIPDYYKPEGE